MKVQNNVFGKSEDCNTSTSWKLAEGNPWQKKKKKKKPHPSNYIFFTEVLYVLAQLRTITNKNYLCNMLQA